MAANAERANTGLKAKEKVLLQLGEHRTEPDQTPLPFEITQKGLSDHLGLRRSHVAMALQDLSKEGMVAARKGHIDGEERRQNAYILTEAGAEKAREIRDGLVKRLVRYEGVDGSGERSIGEILESKKTTLSSVIFQLDRAGAVRDEITIVAQTTKKLIPVFCPTCQKQIEVENIFADEEVGFDCPGCGRPYRIVPALEKRAPQRVERPRLTYLVAAACIAVGAYVVAYIGELCLAVVVAAITGITILVVLVASAPRGAARAAARQTRAATPTGTIVFAILFGMVMLLAWHLFVIKIDLADEAVLVLPLLAGVACGFYGVSLSAAHLRGEFLIAVGILLVLVSVTIMFTEEFGELQVSTAPFLGIIGGALLGLVRFESVEKNEMKLGIAFASGAYLLFLTPLVVLTECDGTGDFIAAGALAAVGVFLVSLRIAQEGVSGHELGEMLWATAPLIAAFGLALLGAVLIAGDAVVAGAFELVVMLPLGYLGVKRVFDDAWMYKLPIVAYLCGSVLLVTVLALHA